MHKCALPLFRILGQVSSLSRSNSYVFSYENIYSIIKKLILVFRSRPGVFHFDLEYKDRYYNNKPHIDLYCQNFVHPCARKSEKFYKWPKLTFVIFNTPSSLIDVRFFRIKYQRRIGKRNGRFCFNCFFSCTQLVPLCRFLWRTSLLHEQHSDSCFISAIRKVENTGRIRLWRNFNDLFSLFCIPSK